MKNLNLKIAGTLALSLLSASTFAQVSQVGNGIPGNAADYVGWNATRPFPLTISHKGNFPILFETAGVQSFATYTVQSCQNTPPKTLPLAH